MASESGMGSRVSSALLGRGQAGLRRLWVEREGHGEAPCLDVESGPGRPGLEAWVQNPAGCLPGF